MRSYSLRLVVQHVPFPSQKSVYRLIAYSDDYDFNRVEFNSLEELVKALNSAIPRFDKNSLSNGSIWDTYIMYSIAVSLNEDQVAGLGLKVR